MNFRGLLPTLATLLASTSSFASTPVDFSATKITVFVQKCDSDADAHIGLMKIDTLPDLNLKPFTKNEAFYDWTDKQQLMLLKVTFSTSHGELTTVATLEDPKGKILAMTDLSLDPNAHAVAGDATCDDKRNQGKFALAILQETK